jgi:hypothetical protein
MLRFNFFSNKLNHNKIYIFSKKIFEIRRMVKHYVKNQQCQ